MLGREVRAVKVIAEGSKCRAK